MAGHDEDQWPGRTEALVPAVRAAIGNDVSLKVDGNSCYTPGKAIEVGRMLEQYGVSHFEEPCPYWELEWTAEVTRFLDLPVAGGEQDYDLNQWQRITWMHAVDIAQPDVCYIGGISRCLRAARMAEHVGDAGGAPLGQPLPGHCLYHAPAGGDPQRGATFRVLDREDALDGWSVHADTGRARRPGADTGWTRLGRADQPGLAVRFLPPDERVELGSLA